LELGDELRKFRRRKEEEVKGARGSGVQVQNSMTM
jgi:hypothetical protein